MTLLDSLLIAAVFTCLVLTLRRKAGKDRRGLPLPPGPRPLPVIGNVFSIPSKNMAEEFRELNREYGDVVYLEAFGKSMVVLGTHQAALDLLEKRSAKYSGREPSAMAQLAAWDWAFSSMAYGTLWRRSRKAFHECFGPAVTGQYRPVQLDTTHRFLLRLLQSPRDFAGHTRYVIGGTTIRLAYGIDIDDERTPYLAIATAAMATFGETFVPGKYLVETFPILRFLPAWFPGARFKRKAAAWKVLVDRLRNTPWDASMSRFSDGIAAPSFARSMMERTTGLDGKSLQEEIALAKDTAAAAYAGGTDTMYCTAITFFLAMAKHTDVQRRAQAELDSVVGQNRLPDFDDWASLPYLSAVLQECVRWGVVLPLGLAHRSDEADEYRGYHIPKGTVIVHNAWAYTRDEQYYPEPEEFKPERYLKDGVINPGVLDPGDIAFGYGRRVCPGRDFGMAALSALAASVLHTFNISPPLDAHGKPLLPLERKVSDGGALAVPEPFGCTIRPRSAEAEALILAAN
ncbi:cytochrome P450 [Trametes elegans]|nr:cytochrome P450 [Trametes elegans]